MIRLDIKLFGRIHFLSMIGDEKNLSTSRIDKDPITNGVLRFETHKNINGQEYIKEG